MGRTALVCWGCIVVQYEQGSADSGRNVLGRKIRTLRRSSRLTQEDLAKGICSPVSISRIENGHQMPSRNVLTALLSRLGISMYQMCNEYYKSERHRAFAEDVCEAQRLLLMGDYDGSQRMVDAIRADYSMSPQRQQVLCSLDASLELFRSVTAQQVDAARMATGRGGDVAQTSGHATVSQVLDSLGQALHLTCPNVDSRDTDALCQLCFDSPCETEICTLCAISAALWQEGQVDDALRLARTLFLAVGDAQSSAGISPDASAESPTRVPGQQTDEVYGGQTDILQMVKVALCCVAAGCLEGRQEFEDELAYARRARDLSCSSRWQVLLPESVYLMARANHGLGHSAEAQHIVRSMVPYLELIDREGLAMMIRGYATTQMGIALC